MISGGFAAKAILNIVLKFGANQPKGREVTGVTLETNKKKSYYAKTKRPIKMISRGFAASDITNVVLKFGDNRAKVRG